MEAPTDKGDGPLRDTVKDQDLEQNGEKGRKHHVPLEASMKERIEHFTWPWFAVTMSTGALSVVLYNTPNQFNGLETIGKIFFILDIMLFALFSLVIGIRFILESKKLIASIHHPVEGLFFGAYFVSCALILNCMQIYGVPNTGPWLVSALRVLYWMYSGVVLLAGIFQYFVLFQKERLHITDAVPAWIFPIYPLLVIGSLAGTILPTQPMESGYPIWVGALMMQGTAWTIALMQYSLYTQRLMSSSLPTPSTRPGMFVSVGPAGYTAAGLISLGTQAPSVIPATAFNTDTIYPDGHIIKVLGIASGTFILLFSFWFFCISVIAVVAGMKQMKFTLNWWAFVFPNAGLTLAGIQLGEAFQSPGINGICSALTIMLVIMWFFTAGAHILAVWRGEILWPGKDEDTHPID